MSTISFRDASEAAEVSELEALRISDTTENEALSALECLPRELLLDPSSSQNASLLVELPRELLLKIIEFVPEAVFELRLVCFFSN